jgi:hypothetical protein
LAQIKIEEAQSRAQRASMLRAASRHRPLSGVTAGALRNRRAALILAAFGRSRARRRSLHANGPRTTKG